MLRNSWEAKCRASPRKENLRFTGLWLFKMTRKLLAMSSLKMPKWSSHANSFTLLVLMSDQAWISNMIIFYLQVVTDLSWPWNITSTKYDERSMLIRFINNNMMMRYDLQSASREFDAIPIVYSFTFRHLLDIEREVLALLLAVASRRRKCLRHNQRATWFTSVCNFIIEFCFVATFPTISFCWLVSHGACECCDSWPINNSWRMCDAHRTASGYMIFPW